MKDVYKWLFYSQMMRVIGFNESKPCLRRIVRRNITEIDREMRVSGYLQVALQFLNHVYHDV